MFLVLREARLANHTAELEELDYLVMLSEFSCVVGQPCADTTCTNLQYCVMAPLATAQFGVVEVVGVVLMSVTLLLKRFL